jgi:hypothetical protein
MWCCGLVAVWFVGSVAFMLALLDSSGSGVFGDDEREEL